jgi:flavodoxin
MKEDRTMKTLVAYFSAESGTTAKVAKELAAQLGAELYEIVPKEPYTQADLKWTNPLARCNREKFGNKEVPVAGKAENFGQYDRVFIGFPIWYGVAPNVVNAFCEGYDWTGKTVALFATSGGSGIGKTAEKLQPYVKGAAIAGAKLCRSASELTDWAKSL